MGCNPFLYYSDPQAVFTLASGTSFMLASGTVDLSLSFMGRFLTFGTRRFSKLISFFFCCSPGISHFQRAFVLLNGVVIRNQNLGARYAHCYWGVFDSRLSEETELEKYVNMYIKHTHTLNVSLFLYFSMCTYVCCIFVCTNIHVMCACVFIHVMYFILENNEFYILKQSSCR